MIGKGLDLRELCIRSLVRCHVSPSLVNVNSSQTAQTVGDMSGCARPHPPLDPNIPFVSAHSEFITRFGTARA